MQVTDEQALIDALNEGSIYGAGLDVLDPDPSPNSPLLDMENVIVLPHVRNRGTRGGGGRGSFALTVTSPSSHHFHRTVPYLV
jgi:hypothetical protein